MEVAKKDVYERGMKIIYPKKAEMWKEYVEIRFSDIYKGEDIKNSITVMEALHSGASLEEVKQIVKEQDYSATSYGLMINAIVLFSKRGTNYVRKYEPEIADNHYEKFEKIDEENFHFEPEETKKEYRQSFLKEKMEIAKEQRAQERLKDRR